MMKHSVYKVVCRSLLPSGAGVSSSRGADVLCSSSLSVGVVSPVEQKWFRTVSSSRVVTEYKYIKRLDKIYTSVFFSLS